MVLTLDMPARLTVPDPRIDAIRGSLALERGPLVYCIKSADLPAGVAVEDVAIDATVEPENEARPDLADPVVGLRFRRPGSRRDRPTVAYRDEGSPPVASPVRSRRDRDPRDPILHVGEPSRWRDAGVDPTTVERRPEDIDDDPR